MSENTRRDDFRATVDSIAADAHELADVEAAKRGLDPADPKVDELSEKAADLGDRIQRKTAAEEELSAAGGRTEGWPRLD
jgi:hypothetical protein